MNERYDYILVGSGAGGGAAAYRLARAGKRVLLLEKGEALPLDGSTLDVDKVIRQGAFKSRETWLDKDGGEFAPEEYFNLGGKTKWYGAAVARFALRELHAVGHAIDQCAAPTRERAEAVDQTGPARVRLRSGSFTANALEQPHARVLLPHRGPGGPWSP